jgi:hypothetical protein
LVLSFASGIFIEDQYTQNRINEATNKFVKELKIQNLDYTNLSNEYTKLKQDYNTSISERDYYKMRYELRKNAVYTLAITGYPCSFKKDYLTNAYGFSVNRSRFYVRSEPVIIDDHIIDQESGNMTIGVDLSGYESLFQRCPMLI